MQADSHSQQTLEESEGIPVRIFVVAINHPLEKFSLENLFQSRIDLAARCVNAALWLDHDVRRDVVLFLCFCNGFVIRVDGNIRKMQPDERNIACFFQKLLDGKKFAGLRLEKKTLARVLRESSGKKFLLDKGGKDLRDAAVGSNAVFVLGDDVGLETARYSQKYFRVSVGPKSYFTSHCITLVNNELDRLS